MFSTTIYSMRTVFRTSLNPNLSEVFLQAALLKVCKPFVAEKMRFDKELESLMKANREFQHATHMVCFQLQEEQLSVIECEC